ncbi:MAG: ribose 5-phosphate isomerase B [Bacteroidetes bacterium]|nr:ribose 5-phosphate isomerase B [Bacteroidota bacterium]MCB0842583.1 ribose 5-phosphate isomerase B [Bacteroidota bacterium]
MKIAIAADHAGFEYKEALKTYLEEKGYEVTDYGTNSPESTDYPDYAHPLATAVADGTYPFGVSVCGSGQGMCITTNKHAGVRAALVWNEEISALARQHNNANVLCLPSRFIDLDYAKKLLDIFLNTEFEGGRHQRRVGKI